MFGAVSLAVNNNNNCYDTLLFFLFLSGISGLVLFGFVAVSSNKYTF